MTGLGTMLRTAWVVLLPSQGGTQTTDTHVRFGAEVRMDSGPEVIDMSWVTDHNATEHDATTGNNATGD